MLRKLIKANGNSKQEELIMGLDRRSLEFLFRMLKMVVSGEVDQKIIYQLITFPFFEVKTILISE